MSISIRSLGRLVGLILVVFAAGLLLALTAVQEPSTQAAPLTAPLATPTPGVNYALGNVCVNDAAGGSTNCTANDVTISSVSPEITEACLAGSDTTTVRFKFQFVGGANERFDIGLYVATDGGSAQTGDNCYKDFLQPSSATGPWDTLGGYGAFYELEGNNADSCADIQQNVSNYYFTQVPVTVSCTDGNGDGVVDPFSTCTSWDNNKNTTCTTVANITPGTDSKCRCDTVTPNPPILIYKGYDWGDLPDTYGTVAGSSGAQHAIQDSDSDNIPNTQGSVAAVWLGPSVDFSPTNGESNGIPTANADGDDLANTPDENGASPIGPWSVGSNGGKFSVQVNSSTSQCTNCQLGFWIDWNNDGDFGEVGETYLKPVSVGTQLVTFDIPVSALPGSVIPANIYVRFRLYAGNYVGSYSPTGLVVNGEVEDYRFNIAPLGVTLADFYAEQVSDYVRLTWETNSEIDNRGFNLYRGMSNAGPDRQLNEFLIPSQSQGSPGGFVYTWDDHADLAPGTSYFYWVEDVDLAGAATMHGPVSVDFTGPTAVTVNDVQANPAATGFALPLAATLAALLAPLAGAVALRRRRSV